MIRSRPEAIREVIAIGSHCALGRQHGGAAADLIHDSYRIRMDRASRHGSEGDILRRAMRYTPFVAKYAPELLEEVNGISEGARLPFERAFFLQVATELELDAQGCTALGSTEAPDGPFLAQNWDQPESSRGNQIILHLRPNDGPEILMFTHAGVLGYIGLNELGLGIVQNQLYAAAKPMGLTGYFLVRKLLAFGSVPLALAWLQGIVTGSSGNYILGDAFGNLVDIELGDGGFQSLRRAAQLHTNHYLLRGWRSPDNVATMLPDSYQRLTRLATLFGTRRDEQTALRALRDHAGYPVSICRHEGHNGIRTVASILLRLRDREVCVCYDNPCVGHYKPYRIVGD